MQRSLGWTTAENLLAQVQKMWESGEILSSLVSGSRLFPRRLKLKAPTAKDIRDHYADVQEWAREIRRVPHCRVETRSFRHSVMGNNVLPQRVWIDSVEDAVNLLELQKQRDRFLQLFETTGRLQPVLLGWIERYPQRALAHYENWDRFLSIAAWLREHPRPGVYLRQVDLPCIDTKFVETHRGILSELLDLVLPTACIDFEVTGAYRFEQRYGFLEKPPRIRFRVLDIKMSVVRGAASSDITLDATSFACLKPDIARVFITENEINYLAFPQVAHSLVLFGAGYGFEMLRGIDWLSRCSISYWGDIDTHGFAILDQLRSQFGCVESFLMDRQTLFSFESRWGYEDRQALHDLPNLTAEERSLYDDLRFNRIRPNLRLEQERIGFQWVESAIRALSYSPPGLTATRQ